MSPRGDAMQGPDDNSGIEPLERSRVYTSTGDAIVRQQFKDPLIGHLLEEKYLIEEVIGWGGMSVVYKARHTLVDRTVAIKTVKFRADERADIWQRFQREIITLSRLSHPNVVTVYDCVVGADGQPYVVMDLIEGCTLDRLLHEQGPLPLRQLCRIASQVASAVEHAHRHNVIHRDLKPANIMILGDKSSEECEVKVVDFGLAKLGEDDQRLTQTGQLWGSPPYISPEQIKGSDADYRCDIYSLGVVVYEMATGQDPFASEVIYEMLHNHLYSEPPSFQSICPDNTPAPELEKVVRRALAKDPADRYQSMVDFKDELEQACLMAENRAAGNEFKNAHLRAEVARASTGRLGLNIAAMPSSRHTKNVSAANVLYFSLTTLLVMAAAIFVLRHGPTVPTKPTLQPVLFSPQFNLKAKSAEKTLLPTHAVHVDKHLFSTAHAHLTSRSISQEPGQPKHTAVLVFPPHHSSVATTVKKSISNPSQLPVDQSKFQLLRDLKSPVLRQDCGDLPQH